MENADFRTRSDTDEDRRDPYVTPTLGAVETLAAVTLFSGTINPDGGTVDFGD